ncbi:MAG: DUF2306 domain-containing protein [Flavobacteriales bacterium]
METLHTLSLVLHIVSGFTALLFGTTILIRRKGGKSHRRSGSIFFIALLAVAFSAFLLSMLNPNPFLFMIGAFTLYQGLSGYRAAKGRMQHVGPWDVLITLLGATNAVAMGLSGQVVLMVFAGISAFLVVGDVRMFTLVIRSVQIPKMLWLQRHIGHMMGSYIATVTAFLVVNFSGPPLGMLLWFAPTVVLVPLIFIWTRRYVARPPTTAGQEAR